tara:strand:+ start:1683 stop:1925 length:243 start_codon:yes stop_codon:yes gene_type:complete
MNRKKSSISLYPAEQIPPIVDKYEYEVGATIDHKGKCFCRFLRQSIGTSQPILYGLHLIQAQYPNSIIELDYFKEYPNVD